MSNGFSEPFQTNLQIPNTTNLPTTQLSAIDMMNLGTTPSASSFGQSMSNIGNSLGNIGNASIGNMGIFGRNYSNLPYSSTDIGNASTMQEAYKMQMANQTGMQTAAPSLMEIGGTLLNAYNMYSQIGMQNDYMDLMKEQLGMAKEQWAMTKDEVSRIAKVRNNLNTGYRTGTYQPAPKSKTYTS